MTEPPTAETSAFQDIAGVFAGVEQMFLNLEHDYKNFRAFWAPDIEAPVYIAEEHKEIIADWASLENYFEAAAKILGPVVCKYDLKAIVPIQPDLVTAYCQMEWQAAIKPEVEKMGGYVRVVAVLRKSSAGWRFISYVEAPLAPIVYLGELYKRVAKISTLGRP
jgi:hypothetical protein